MREICRLIETPAVTALSQVAEALAAIGDARMADAYGLIDEAMLPVLADQVPIDWAGDIYCVVLNQCHRLADLPRMTGVDAVDGALVQRLRRVRQLRRGVRRTPAATAGGHRRLPPLEDRLAASQMLEDVNSWAAGEGYYQLGEVRRLRGDADGAFMAFAGRGPGHRAAAG